MKDSLFVSNSQVEAERSKLESVREALGKARQAFARLEELETRMASFVDLLEGVVVAQAKVNAAVQEIPEYFSEESSLESPESPRGKAHARTFYEEQIKKYYGSADVAFTESDIRHVSTVDGLMVKNKAISKGYSSYILKALVDEGFLERVGKGLYRMVQADDAILESVNEVSDRVDEDDDDDLPTLPE